MLTITLPESKGEYFNEATNEFLYFPEVTLELEHSLVSISKWEAKWHIPYITPDNKPKTLEQSIDYIRCMTLNEVPDECYNRITQVEMDKITAYMEDPMTATTVRHGDNNKPSKKIITSEEIYYMMIANQIPVEFETWHINRLMMLIDVCQVKGNPGKKMGRNETLEYQRQLNAARRKKK